MKIFLQERIEGEKYRAERKMCFAACSVHTGQTKHHNTQAHLQVSHWLGAKERW
jgi:hypothetical protein